MKTCSSKRNVLPDELSSFLERGKITFQALQNKLIINKRFVVPVTVFMINKVLFIQSQQFFFMVFHCFWLRFTAIYASRPPFGVKCYIPSLSKNYITLNSKEIDYKMQIIHQQILVMDPVTVGNQLYGPEIIVRAFEYFATSRTLYNCLRKDHQLPSITILTRITFSLHFSRQCF